MPALIAFMTTAVRGLVDRGPIHHPHEELALQHAVRQELLGVGRPAQHDHRSGDRLSRERADMVYHRRRIGQHHEPKPVNFRGLHVRLVHLELPQCQRIALEVAVVVARRLQPERLELRGDVRRGRFEPRARRIAAHHRVVGNDTHPPGHVGLGNGAGGLGDGLGRRRELGDALRGQRCCGCSEQGQTEEMSHRGPRERWSCDRDDDLQTFQFGTGRGSGRFQGQDRRDCCTGESYWLIAGGEDAAGLPAAISYWLLVYEVRSEE